MRILLGEDNADHRELMCLALTEYDATWQVEGVVSGEEALRRLAEGEAYDLVFLDYSLPGRDGLEVLGEIRRGEAPPPVVMVTGRGDEQVAVEAMKGGAYDYVVKGEGYLQRLPVVAQRAVEAHQLAVERKRIEDEMQKTQQLLFQAQKMKALGTLVSGVAHEINNPINLVKLNAPLLQKICHDFMPILQEHAEKKPHTRYGGLTYQFLEENLEQLLLDINMAADRIKKIVSNLKNFARQSDVTDKKPISINGAVVNAMRFADAMIKKPGTKLAIDLGGDLPQMEGDLQSIEQVVLNLVINALQAIDHGKGKIEIVTGFDKKRASLYVAVSDNGGGIDPSIADRIFDPFVTTKQTEGGIGLGLSVTYSLVQAHGGEISFNSQKGKGTTFQVFFPVKQKEKVAKILVADDDKNIVDLLRDALTKDRPYVVEDASNGNEACIKLGVHRPDLLILDLVMPEMDGLDVCRTIKKSPELSGVQLILLTGFPDDPKVEEIRKLGFTHIYGKPFKLTDLIKTVDEILKNYTQRQKSQHNASFPRKRESRKTLDSGSSPE